MGGRTCVLVCTFFIVAWALWASAELGRTQENPCKADIERFCADVTPGQGRIADCLKDHESELSQDCKDFRSRKGAELKEKAHALKEACQKDIERLCKDVAPGKGRIVSCLKEHEAEVSDECKQVLGTQSKGR